MEGASSFMCEVGGALDGAFGVNAGTKQTFRFGFYISVIIHIGFCSL